MCCRVTAAARPCRSCRAAATNSGSAAVAASCLALQRIISMSIGAEVESLVGEGVGHAAGVARCLRSRDHPRVLEPAQPVGEDVRCHVLLAFEELAVAVLVLEQDVPNDEERPAITEHVERVADRAIGSPRVEHTAKPSRLAKCKLSRLG